MSFTNRSIARFSISVSVFILAVYLSATAQTPSPTAVASPTPTLEHEFFKNIVRDQKAIWTAPLHLHERDGRWLAPIGLGTAALIATDQRTGDEMAESTSQLNASRIVSYAGSAYGVGAVAGAFYIAGRAGHDPRARETGLLGAEALVDSAIVVTAVKEIAQRTRPSGGRSRSDFFDGGSSFQSPWPMSITVISVFRSPRTELPVRLAWRVSPVKSTTCLTFWWEVRWALG